MQPYPTARFDVQGFTDSTGGDAANAKIARERADAVALALEGLGVAKDRLLVQSLGALRGVRQLESYVRLATIADDPDEAATYRRIAQMMAGFLAQGGRIDNVGVIHGLPVALSAYLLISGTLGICVFSSVSGKRRADYGREAVLDPESRQHLRLRALLAVSASLIIAGGFAFALVSSS